MKSVEYSQLVKRKLLKLKKELAGEYGEEKTKESVILSLQRVGQVVVAQRLIHRAAAGLVDLLDELVFNEREDVMMKLFGISGRTQESIDYWGE